MKRDRLKAIIIQEVNKSIAKLEEKKDVWKGKTPSINSIQKYLSAIKVGTQLYIDKLEFVKSDVDVFTSDKYVDLSLKNLAKVMESAYKSKKPVQVEL